MGRRALGGREGGRAGTSRDALTGLSGAAFPSPRGSPSFPRKGLFWRGRGKRGRVATTHMGSKVLLSQDFSASKFSMIILTTIQSGPGPPPPRQQQQQQRRRGPRRPAGRDPGSRRASPYPPRPRPPPGSAEAAWQGPEAQRHEGGGTSRAAAAPCGPRSRRSLAGERGPAAPQFPPAPPQQKAAPPTGPTERRAPSCGSETHRPPPPLSRRARQSERASR